MIKSEKRISSFMAILLIWGYGLTLPTLSNAAQRTKHVTDSIAYAMMNRSEMLSRGNNKKCFLLEIRLRSSELHDMSRQKLGSDEVFYVYGDSSGGKGFVIVSVDDRMPEILAYSHEESFQSESMPASTRYWLECYIDEYLSLYSLNAQTDEALSQSTDIRPDGVEPILGKLPWGQSDPYNGLCPLSFGGRCVVGCVATAMSQVMWTYKWPACGKGNIEYETRTHHIRVKMNLADHPIRWDMIKEEYQRGKYSEEEANAVATLMAICGAAVHMDYAPDGSGARQSDILKALVNNFYYDPDAAFLPREYFTSSDWHSLLLSELNSGRAVNYAGQSRTDGGHSFVIDGYEAGSSATNPYYHLNWGWNGHCNGYYSLPNLHPSEDGRYYVKEGFTTGHQMLIGVHPDDGETEANKMLRADGLRVMQALLKPGESSVLRVNDISNLCYRTFQGQIALQLRDEEGNSFIVGKTPIDPIPFLENISNQNFSFTLPETIEEGKYNVKLIGINNDGQITEMYSRSSPQITVSRNPYGDEESDGLTLLCSSEFEVYKQTELDSILNVNIYELYNYSDEILEGDLQLEIASKDGTSIMTIGTSVWHPAFGAQEAEQFPVTLYGSVPDSLSNGEYRLYVLFYPVGQSSACRVKFYDRIDPTKVPVEYYLPMIISDKGIVVNNVSFPNTTNIPALLNKTHVHPYICSINGILQQNKRKGIHIIRMSDGTCKKVWIRQ